VQSNLCLQFKHRGYPPSTEKETVSASDEDAIADVMEQHDQFVSSMQSRSAKLQVIMKEVMLVVNWMRLLLLYVFILHRIFL
jgi:nitrate/nitrite-specific signal transduction histidine kinase